MKIFSKNSVAFIVLWFCLGQSCKKANQDIPAPIVQTSDIKDGDGNVYHAVTIGTQVWLAENLNTKKFRDGTPIPNVADDTTWKYLQTGAYCDYENNPSNSAVYGRLYNWYAVSNNHKICPDGWHIPSDAEWATMITYLGGEPLAGGKLKETGTAHWKTPNTSATNETGFAALPGGYRTGNGLFYDIRVSGNFWSSTESSTNDGWFRRINYADGNAVRSDLGRTVAAFSIRCIKD